MPAGITPNPEWCVARSTSVISCCGETASGMSMAGINSRHRRVQPHSAVLNHSCERKGRERLGDRAHLKDRIGSSGAIRQDAPGACCEMRSRGRRRRLRQPAVCASVGEVPIQERGKSDKPTGAIAGSRVNDGITIAALCGDSNSRSTTRKRKSR